MRFGTSTAWSNAGWSNARAWADAKASAQRIAADERDLQQRFWRKLRRLAARLPFAEDLIAAHYCAFDRRTPLRVKAALVGYIFMHLKFDNRLFRRLLVTGIILASIVYTIVFFTLGIFTSQHGIHG